MKRIVMAGVVMMAFCFWARADEPRYVYAVVEIDNPMSGMALDMAIAAEAMRLYAPIEFTNNSGRLMYESKAEAWFSLDSRPEEVARTRGRKVIRYAITTRKAAVLPKASKRMTLRFSVSELAAKGERYATSPLMYAIKRAVDASSYTSGLAWIESAKFSFGRFVVVVALKQ